MLHVHHRDLTCRMKFKELQAVVWTHQTRSEERRPRVGHQSLPVQPFHYIEVGLKADALLLATINGQQGTA